MEQPNYIDKVLRQRLQQAEIPPPGFVWRNVERALQRRKRRFWLWFFVIGIASASIWIFLNRPGEAALPTPAPAINTPSKTPANSTPQAAAGQRPVLKTPALTTAPGAHISDGHPLEGKKVPALNASQKTAAMPANTISPQLPAPPQGALQEDNPTENALSESGLRTVRPGASKPATLADAGLLPGRLALLDAPDHKPGLSPIAMAPSNLKKKAPKKCYDFHTNRQAWLLDAYAGPSFARKGLYTNDPEFKSYVQDRLDSEKREWAFHAGLRASYLFAENFIIRTGLHYDQFVEQFEFIDPKYIKYTIIITQQFINGQWVSVPDTVDIQYGANYIKTYNRFALLDIPLQAALELRSGATGISLNLGGSVNVLFHKRGSMLALDGKPVGITQYGAFQPKVGLSLLGSIQWFYHITPRTRLFAEPYYRHILEPVTRPDYPVDQSYGIGGIRFGVTQIFD